MSTSACSLSLIQCSHSSASVCSSLHPQCCSSSPNLYDSAALLQVSLFLLRLVLHTLWSVQLQFTRSPAQTATCPVLYVCNPHCHISIFHPRHIQPAVIFHLLSNYSPLAARFIITNGKCSYQLIADREMVNVNVCIYNNGNLSKFLKSFVQCYEDLLFHLSARGGAMCLTVCIGPV